MTSKRLYFLLIGIISLLFIGLIAGTMSASSLLQARADKLVALKAKSKAQEQEKIGLAKAKKEIAKYSALEKITKTIVPEDKSQAEAVREIVKIAGDNGVTLASITFPASTLGGTSASGAAPSPAAAAAAANKKSLSQLEAVKNIPGVYKLQIVITSDTKKPVPYSQFINFLSDLENNRRTAQVSNIVLQPDQNNRNNLTFTLTLNGYIKP